MTHQLHRFVASCRHVIQWKNRLHTQTIKRHLMKFLTRVLEKITLMKRADERTRRASKPKIHFDAPIFSRIILYITRKLPVESKWMNARNSGIICVLLALLTTQFLSLSVSLFCRIYACSIHRALSSLTCCTGLYVKYLLRKMRRARFRFGKKTCCLESLWYCGMTATEVRLGVFIPSWIWMLPSGYTRPWFSSSSPAWHMAKRINLSF